jgi:hypothetical protein
MIFLVLTKGTLMKHVLMTVAAYSLFCSSVYAQRDNPYHTLIQTKSREFITSLSLAEKIDYCNLLAHNIPPADDSLLTKLQPLLYELENSFIQAHCAIFNNRSLATAESVQIRTEFYNYCLLALYHLVYDSIQAELTSQEQKHDTLKNFPSPDELESLMVTEMAPAS